jgi:hypothetical protein
MAQFAFLSLMRPNFLLAMRRAAKDGSGSFEKDSAVYSIAMEKEKRNHENCKC